VLLSYLIGPFFHAIGLNFNCFSAFSANQVVVVSICAGPIQDLAVV
jgi:hypothetical protein